MNPKLTARAAHHGGVFSREDALACGYTESQLRERIKRGTWTTLRRGYFTSTADLGGLPPWEAESVTHKLSVRAAARALEGSNVVMSHQSAVAMHGIPMWGCDLADVHVTRRDALTSRVRSGIHHHVGRLPEEAVTVVDGVAVTSAARAVVELACVSSYESAVIAMDAALHHGYVGRADLRSTLAAVTNWPGSGTARAAAAFADSGSESVGESRLRVLMDNHGLPAPVLQARFGTSEDDVVARVDFYFRDHGVVVEFDGLVKYRDAASSVVVAEKVREDRLRAMGLIVVRVTWAELASPDLVVRRIRRALQRGLAVPHPANPDSAHGQPCQARPGIRLAGATFTFTVIVMFAAVGSAYLSGSCLPGADAWTLSAKLFTGARS